MSAPRVTVRAHIPWHWRALITILLLIATALLVSWIYVISSRYSGFDNTSAELVGSLRSRVEVLETEAEHLRSISNGSEASLQIERTVQQKLSEQVKRLEAENNRLREDMAAFESLASGDTKNNAVSIHRMRVIPASTAGDACRYRFFLAAPVSRPAREFKGRLQMVATIQQGGETVTVNISDTDASDPQRFLVSFKYFRRIEGSFMLPANAVLKKLEVRLMQGLTVVASQQVTV
ncbi:MAG: DUF6776 family protein [Georgfuchsia sp.]